MEIEIFKTGTHESQSGSVDSWGLARLKEIVETYDPARFRAPLILSSPPHDTKGIPDNQLAESELAYGYPDSLELREKDGGHTLVAKFKKMAGRAKQWFDEGQILALSSSIFMPGSRDNPTPGKFSLRHISMLGVSQPAVNGLAAPAADHSASIFKLSEFNLSPDQEFIQFAMPYGDSVAKTLFSRLRDYLIESIGLEQADRILSPDMLSNLDYEAQQLSTIVADYENALSSMSSKIWGMEDKIDMLQSRLDSTLESAGLNPMGYSGSAPESTTSTSSTEELMTTKKNATTPANHSTVVADPAPGSAATPETGTESISGEENPESSTPEETAARATSSTPNSSTSQEANHSTTIAELQQQLRDQQDRLNAQEQALNHERAILATERAAAERSQVTTLVEGLVADHRLPAGNTEDWVSLILNVSKTSEVNFSAGKASPRDQLLAMLGKLPQIVSRGEVADPGSAPYSYSANSNDGIEPAAGYSLDPERSAAMQKARAYCKANDLDHTNIDHLTQALHHIETTGG